MFKLLCDDKFIEKLGFDGINVVVASLQKQLYLIEHGVVGHDLVRGVYSEQIAMLVKAERCFVARHYFDTVSDLLFFLVVKESSVSAELD